MAIDDTQMLNELRMRWWHFFDCFQLSQLQQCETQTGELAMRTMYQHARNNRKVKDSDPEKTTLLANTTRTDPTEAIPPIGEMTSPKQQPTEGQAMNDPKRRKYDKKPNPTTSTTSAAPNPSNETIHLNLQTR